MVSVLRKIENGLNDRAEARNYFYDRYVRNPKLVIPGKKDIKTFEAEHEAELKEKMFIEKTKEAQRKQEELQKKQQEKMKNKKSTKNQGRWDQFRSAKKQFKVVEKKIDNLDEQTKDEKMFLDEELFDILQDVKGKMDRGEFDQLNDDDDLPNTQPEKASLGKLGKMALNAKENAEN